MNSFHTPGNWQYRPITQNGLNRPYEKYEIFSRTESNYKDKWGYCVDFGSEYYDIAVVRNNHSCTEANAKLIAAAPDLLAACQIVLNNLTVEQPHKELNKLGNKANLDALQAAIQKAIN